MVNTRTTSYKFLDLIPNGEKLTIMTAKNVSSQGILDSFLTDVTLLSQQFPHRAIASYSERTNTYFYNVYFTSVVEEALMEIETDGFDAYSLLADFAEQGYNISLKPKNKLGFCQCTVSYTVDGVKGKETHLLSGEGGTMHNAVVSVYLKFRLILTPEGNWSFTAGMIKSDKKFR